MTKRFREHSVDHKIPGKREEETTFPGDVTGARRADRVSSSVTSLSFFTRCAPLPHGMVRAVHEP